MPRVHAVGITALALLLSGCGGGEDNSASSNPESLPPLERTDGDLRYNVESQAEADRLCEQVQTDPPAELKGEESVSFFKGQENLSLCVLPLPE